MLDYVNFLFLFKIIETINKTMPNSMAIKGTNKNDLAKNTT